MFSWFLFLSFLFFCDYLSVWLFFFCFFYFSFWGLAFSGFGYILSFLSFSLLFLMSMFFFSFVDSLLLRLTLLFSFAFFNCDNLVIFFVSFELMIFLFFFYISFGGSSFSKISSSFFLLFYTIGFSYLFLFGIFLFNYDYLTMSMSVLMMVGTWDSFLTFNIMMVFCVKLPLLIAHFWLPKAHVDSPIIGSMILAGLVLKMGGFGFILFGGNFINDRLIMSILLVWSVISCFLVVVFCFFDFDLKSIVAYSSVGHMSMFSFSFCGSVDISVLSCMLMMVAHGFTSPLMFWALGNFYNSMSTRNVGTLWGVNVVNKSFSFMMISSLFLNVGFPPFISFWSEFFFISSLITNSLVFVFPLFLILNFYGYFNVYLNSKISMKMSFDNVGFDLSVSFSYYLIFFLFFFLTLTISLVLWIFWFPFIS